MEEKISFEEFSKVDLRVGRILKVDEHPNADKLFVLKVDLGLEERTIVAGLRGIYNREELIGKQGIFVVNLEPRELRGVESNGMILAVGDEPVILIPEKEVKEGEKVR
jgi:methionyl-tRNA synthetase